MCSVLLFVACYSVLVAGQDFSVPTTWRKPTMSDTFEQQVIAAKAVVANTLPLINPSTGNFDSPNPFQLAADLFLQMSALDVATGSTGYKDIILGHLTTLSKNPSSNGFLNGFLHFVLEYGIASFRAFQAYGDTAFRDLAVSAWETASKYQITADQVSSGNTPQKGFSLIKTCQGGSIAGAVFHVTDQNDDQIENASTSSFVTLSALLGESFPNDQKYLAAAALSTNFLMQVLWDTNDPTHLNRGVVHAKQSDNCLSLIGPNAGDNGIAIEAMSILGSVTSNASLSSFATNVFAQNTKSFQDGQGVYNASMDHTSVFRGFLSEYVRNSNNVALRNYVGAYFAVQYNALRDMAREPGTDVYSFNLDGPPAQGGTISIQDQTAALSVIIPSIAIWRDISTNTGSSGSNDNPSSSSPMSPSGTSNNPSSPSSPGVSSPNPPGSGPGAATGPAGSSPSGSGSNVKMSLSPGATLPPGSDPSSPSSVLGSVGHKLASGIIAGIVIGILVVVCVVFGAWYHRRRKRMAKKVTGEEFKSSNQPTPFTLPPLLRSSRTATSSYFSSGKMKSPISVPPMSENPPTTRASVASPVIAEDLPRTTPPPAGNELTTPELMRLLQQRLRANSEGVEDLQDPPTYTAAQRE